MIGFAQKLVAGVIPLEKKRAQAQDISVLETDTG
jgi:hypothetical protein